MNIGRGMIGLMGSAMTLLIASNGMARTIIVAGNGSGDFKTVQEAVSAAPDNSSDEIVIHIKPGTYLEQVIVPVTKPHLTFEGEDSVTTILSWDQNVFQKHAPGADGFNPGVQIKANDFTAKQITFQNTAGDHGQALAVRADGDRGVFLNCRLIGWQDTLMINNGRDYFKDCYIAGRVDFIYGSATAWFETCEIHSRNGGHVTAASTPQDHLFGFVFNECKLTGDDIAWDPATTNPATTQKAKKTPGADLGRPWRPYASVTYLNCKMGDHIRPYGWNNWRNPANEKTARYAEYNTTGPGAAPEKRLAWAKKLTKEEADKITLQTVLGGSDQWNPSK
jgi:pectinesterase